MEENYSEPFDFGINDDTYVVWRNSGHIGYVHLAMKVITEAMYDLVLGEYNHMMSAYYFFFGSPYESYYFLWAKVLGVESNQLPDIVIRARDGYVDQNDLETIRSLCTVVKTI